MLICCFSLSFIRLCIGKNFTIRYLSWYIAIRCILRYFVIFHEVYWICKNSAEIQVDVYDLLSLNTSHCIILIIQFAKWIRTIGFKNFFPIYFGIGKLPNTDAAAITSTWKMQLKCTFGLNRTLCNRGGCSSHSVWNKIFLNFFLNQILEQEIDTVFMKNKCCDALPYHFLAQP